MDNFNDNNDELIESISEDEDMNALVETLENIPVDDGTIKDNIEISEQILVSSVSYSIFSINIRFLLLKRN